jgi:6-pyruvoyltetrahydropterin/6-carboxytetrahydropterin synthase
MSGRYRLQIARELFKFSCAHMTIFPDGSKERLHGHNYYVGIAIDVSDIAFASMVPFAPIKDAVSALCNGLRERTLVAERNPFFRLTRHDADEIEFQVCGRRYVLPADEVTLLPIDNVAVETLAAHFVDLLVERLDELRRPVVTGIEITVTESPGQGASCYRDLNRP